MLSRYARVPRHLKSVLEHSTLRKLVNLLLVEAQYRLRTTTVRGRPYILIVDPINVCNLRCPLCATGIDARGRKAMTMDWDIFMRIVDENAPYAYEINLYNWGESLLHPKIYDMIGYARDRNLATNLSSNFNRIREGDIDNLIASGLEFLCLSIDGATQPTYAKYRVNGDLATVLKNARELIRRRRELKSKTPYVEWQFILFRHNSQEVEAARSLAAEIGIDSFRVISAGVPFDAERKQDLKNEWFVDAPNGPGNDEGAAPRNPGACFYLYRSATFNPDGKVSPCCIVYGENNDFGDANTQGFRPLWNNEMYRSARALFTRNGQVHKATVCDRCDWFQQRNPRAISQLGFGLGENIRPGVAVGLADATATGAPPTPEGDSDTGRG
jgi:radical SAM protein with 4Fe4S-binding SPASM domain